MNRALAHRPRRRAEKAAGLGSCAETVELEVRTPFFDPGEYDGTRCGNIDTVVRFTALLSELEQAHPDPLLELFGGHGALRGRGRAFTRAECGHIGMVIRLHDQAVTASSIEPGVTLDVRVHPGGARNT